MCTYGYCGLLTFDCGIDSIGAVGWGASDRVDSRVCFNVILLL